MLENINYVNNSILLKQKADDFYSETLEEEEIQLKEELRKRKLTLISLGSVYILLILASFTFLT
ncbi:MAG: hypothetical protein H6610_08645 [Ignavibacteriales bacterium]|nr:hypothetical protein [Ignavibacteriales bacterium]MCB9219510.1 hypothetical protein [Ignavibacteriales bacterium]